jgi:hypothetical protein
MVIECGEGAATHDKMLRKVAKTLTEKLAPIRDGQLEKNTDTKRWKWLNTIQLFQL